MSRIYEALQKAESERQQGREGAPEQVSRVPASQTAVADYEAMHEPQPPVAERRYAAAPMASTAISTGFDLNQVARYPWSPSVTQLPSLLDRGPAVEQFRSLRSRMHELRDIKPLKSILVSSGQPQEGKSFIAANLAISLARHKNSKVLLIDGDMRRYTLHQLLGCEPHPGLADYLAGKAGLLEVMQRAEESAETAKAAHTALANLTFIPGGNGGDRAADLSGNPRFAELIRTAAPHFDWIIVDSSPVLPVSDGVNLARACDGVLLVARAGTTKFPVAQRAQSELKSANVLGFVLNAMKDAPQVGNYYGYDAEKE